MGRRAAALVASQRGSRAATAAMILDWALVGAHEIGVPKNPQNSRQAEACPPETGSGQNLQK
jgi:hypothetical protein